MAIEKTIVLKVDNKGAVESIKEVDKELNNLDKSNSEVTKQLDKMSNGFFAIFSNLVKGARSGIKAMQGLKLAIASTGVGLLVIALGSLVAFFTQTTAGADKLKIAFAAIGAVITNVIEVATKIGEILFNIFDKPLSDSISGIGDAFKGMGDEIKRDIDLAIELEKAIQLLRDTEIGQIRVQAQRRAMISQLRLDAENIQLGFDERIAALRLAGELERVNLEEQVDNQKARIIIAEGDLELATDKVEANRTLQEAEAQLFRLTEKSNLQRLRFEDDLQKLIEKRRLSIDRDKPDAAVETFTKETEELIVANEVRISSINGLIAAGEKQRTDIEKENAETRTTIAEEEAKAKQNLLMAVAQGLAAVGDIVGRETAAGKALAVASSLISTYSAIAGQLAAFAGVPVPGYAIAQAIATGLVGFAAVKNIVSTKVPGGFGGNAAIPGSVTDGSAGGAGQPAFNIVGTSATNQLADVINNKSNAPAKAYVVASEVSTQQELDRNIVKSATFGG